MPSTLYTEKYEQRKEIANESDGIAACLTRRHLKGRRRIIMQELYVLSVEILHFW